MNEWINVKDELPEENIVGSSDCLIAIQYKYSEPDESPTLCCGYLLDGKWYAYADHSYHRIGDGNDHGDEVTHWMPLPEPPNQERNN